MSGHLALDRDPKLLRSFGISPGHAAGGTKDPCDTEAVNRSLEGSTTPPPGGVEPCGSGDDDGLDVVGGSPMTTTLLLVAVVIVTAMVLDSTNGFHDRHRALRPRARSACHGNSDRRAGHRADHPHAESADAGDGHHVDTAAAMTVNGGVLAGMAAATVPAAKAIVGVSSLGVAAPTWQQRSRTGSALTAINVAGGACPAVFGLIGRDGYQK